MKNQHQQSKTDDTVYSETKLPEHIVPQAFSCVNTTELGNTSLHADLTQDATEGKPRYLSVTNIPPQQNVRHALSIGGKAIAKAADQGELIPKTKVKTGKGEGKKELVTVLTVKPSEYASEADFELGLLMMSEEQKEEVKNNIRELCKQMGDLTADIYDVVTYLYWDKVDRGLANDGFVPITTDEILEFRGLQKKLDGEGYTSGFRPDQHEAVIKQLYLMTWLHVETQYNEKKGKEKRVKTIRSPLLLIYKGIDWKQADLKEIRKAVFLVCPGYEFREAVMANRMTALLPLTILKYDYAKFYVEKRIGRYLVYIWRVRQNYKGYSDPHNLSTLIEVAGLTERYKKSPTEVINRIKKALERLQKDKVIADVKWGRNDKGELVVITEPPQEIKDHYSKIREVVLQQKVTKLIPDIEQKVLNACEQLGISKYTAAKEMGINKGTLHNILSGKRKPSVNDRKKMEKWLKGKGVL